MFVFILMGFVHSSVHNKQEDKLNGF